MRIKVTFLYIYVAMFNSLKNEGGGCGYNQQLPSPSNPDVIETIVQYYCKKFESCCPIHQYCIAWDLLPIC